MTTTLKLYETTDALADVLAQLEENGGELTPDLEALLDSAHADFAEKVERTALKVREFRRIAEAQKAEADLIAARARASTKLADSLTAYLHRHMELAGTPKVVGLLATVALQNNPPALDVDDAQWDEHALRGLAMHKPEWVTVTPERYALNKRAFIDLAKAGHSLPDGMTLVVRQSVRIR